MKRATGIKRLHQLMLTKIYDAIRVRKIQPIIKSNSIFIHMSQSNIIRYYILTLK